MQTTLQICLGAIKIALNRDPPHRGEAIAALDRYLIQSRRGKTQIECETPIAELGLSERVLNFLDREGIITVGALEACTAEELLSIPNFGQKCLDEVKACLAKVGRRLKDDTFIPSLGKALETLHESDV